MHGAPFGSSPMSVEKVPHKLNLAVVLETGERYWQAGSIPGAAADDLVLGVGQTHHAGGWTITSQGARTVIKNDVSGRTLILNGLDEAHFNTNVKVYKAISAEEIQALAQQYLKAEDFYEIAVV